MLSKLLEYETEIPKGTELSSIALTLKYLCGTKVKIEFDEDFEDIPTDKLINLSGESTVGDLLDKLCSACCATYEFAEPNIIRVYTTDDKEVEN